MGQILTGALVLNAKRGQTLVRLRAQLFSAKRHYVPRFSEKFYMVGQTYRLIKATMAVARGVVLQACRVLPEDSIVVVESSGDAGRTVNIRCEHQELWMFTVDLNERGSLLSAGGETPNRTIETAYAIARSH
jgi:hypothetical protein